MDISWKYVKALKKESLVDDFLDREGIRLPDQLKEIIKKQNGGRPSETSIITSDGKEHVFQSLLSYNANDPETVYDAYDSYFRGKSCFPIGTDPAGNFICFDTEEGSFVFFDHESEKGIRIRSIRFMPWAVSGASSAPSA
jgi:hypothetical protein